MEPSISPPPSSVQNRSSRISYREDSNDRSGQSLSPYRNSSRAPLFRQQRESRSSSSRPRISEDVPQDKEKQPAAAPATPEESRGPLAILRQDYRASLPPILARFTGYRPKDNVGPLYPPVWPLKWLTRIPIKYEIWLFGWIGAFVSIVLVEAVMSASALFQQYQVPLIIGSFGASAVLIYGMSDAPVSQVHLYSIHTRTKRLMFPTAQKCSRRSSPLCTHSSNHHPTLLSPTRIHYSKQYSSQQRV